MTLRLLNTLVLLSILILCASSFEARPKGHSHIKDVHQYESTLLQQAKQNNKESMVKLGYLYLDVNTAVYNKDQGYAWLDRAALLNPNFEKDLPIIKMLYQHPKENRQLFWLIHAAQHKETEAVKMLLIND
jgi:hypothetical protein